MSIFDNNLTKVEIVEYLDAKTLQEKYAGKVSPFRECAVIDFEVSLPFPMTTKRRYLNVASIEYNPKLQQYLLVHKPCKHSNQLPKGWYEMYDFQIMLLRKIDDERTLFTEAHIFNLDGWGKSQTLHKVTALDRGKGMQKIMLDFLHKAQEGKIKLDTTNDQVYKLAQYAFLSQKTKAE